MLAIAASSAKARDLSVQTALSAVDEGHIEAIFTERFAVVDGDIPNTVSAPYPGCGIETLWLGDVIDERRFIGKRTELSRLYDEQLSTFERARQLLFSADQLISDNRRTVMRGYDEHKIKLSALKTADELLGDSGEKSFFITSGRFGSVGISDSLSGFEVTAFKDEFGGCAGSFMKTLYSEAIRRGLGVSAGFSPLYPYSTPELLLFPDSGKAFFHKEGCFLLSRTPDRVISDRRFLTDRSAPAVSRQLFADRKAAEKLLSRSGELFAESAALRNEISQLGGEAADSEQLRRMSELLRRRLFSDSGE